MPVRMMSTIDALFQNLRQSGRKAFMPFVTAGDPDLDFTSAVLKRMAARGCHLFELGIPYSDPIADGPVIQASYTRALENQTKVGQIMEMARGTLPRPEYSNPLPDSFIRLPSPPAAARNVMRLWRT